MHNIEIKSRLANRDAVLDHMERLGAEFVWERHQRDTFFQVTHGWLKLRQVEGEPPELIAYMRELGTEPRPSDYDIAAGGSGWDLETVLTRSLGVRGVVDKVRRLYLWQHTRIHLDEVAGLGSYLELETVARKIPLDQARAEAAEVIEALRLDEGEFQDRPYLELLEHRSASVS